MLNTFRIHHRYLRDATLPECRPGLNRRWLIAWDNASLSCLHGRGRHDHPAYGPASSSLVGLVSPRPTSHHNNALAMSLALTPQRRRSLAARSHCFPGTHSLPLVPCLCSSSLDAPRPLREGAALPLALPLPRHTGGIGARRTFCQILTHGTGGHFMQKQLEIRHPSRQEDHKPFACQNLTHDTWGGENKPP